MNGNDEEWSRAERVWWGGLDRGSVENRCNRPRTLCFNSLRADVCLRSGTFLHFSSIYPCTCIRVRVYTYAHERTAGPPATVHLRVHVHTYVCTTSTGTRCRVLSILGITRIAFLLECYRVLAPIRGCKRVPLSLSSSLFPLNNYSGIGIVLFGITRKNLEN